LDRSHSTNAGDEGYSAKILEATLHFRKILKTSLVGSDELGSFWVTDTLSCLGTIPPTMPEKLTALRPVLGRDGVHFTDQGRFHLFTNLAHLIVGLNSGKIGSPPKSAVAAALSSVPGRNYYWRGFKSDRGSVSRPIINRPTNSKGGRGGRGGGGSGGSGTPGGNGVVNVGGQYYTSQVDAATSSNTATTLVKRDANGQFSGRLDGIAGKADVITNARNFSISGGDITASAQSFDGSAAITLSASLNAVPSLGAGTYGSQTQIPVIQVAANGRVMNVVTTTISTNIATAGDTGTGSVNLLNDTLNFAGQQGITTAASGNTVTFNVDDTVVTLVT
jgi:hypothetical protein